MSTYLFPPPREFAQRLGDHLGIQLTGQTFWRAISKDAQGRRCARWDAEWFEVAAFYVARGTDLSRMEELLAAEFGCVRTTTITGHPARIADEDWPGWTRRKNREDLRPQVLALFADPPGGKT